MNQLTTIQGVRAFIDKDGTAQLHQEDVARGLGFVERKGEVEYIRWGRLNGYMAEFGFATSGENEFIPENIFYLLAMKANNETAISFQKKVACEILPSIRKHGMYAKDELLDNPDLMIEVITQLKREREEKKLLQAENNLLSGKVLTWTSRKVLDAIIKAYGSSIKLPNINGFQEAWRDFKKELLYNHSININLRISNYMESSGKRTKPSTLNMIHEDELAKCIGTAAALCRSKGVDISEVLAKYQTS
jgi:prophage antirepressor-like protein